MCAKYRKMYLKKQIKACNLPESLSFVKHLGYMNVSVPLIKKKFTGVIKIIHLPLLTYEWMHPNIKKYKYVYEFVLISLNIQKQI